MSILNGEGAKTEYTGISFAGKGQNLDNGFKVIHNAPNTSSVVNAKSISKDGGKCTYRSLSRINENARNGLQEYMKFLKKISGEDYIFKGKNNGGHLSRSQAFRIIKHAAGELNLENGISCHSMRKTFGYYAWKCGTPPAVLMDIYNHSSYEITKRYLGIKQDDKDSVFLNVNL